MDFWNCNEVRTGKSTKLKAEILTTFGVDTLRVHCLNDGLCWYCICIITCWDADNTQEDLWLCNARFSLVTSRIQRCIIVLPYYDIISLVPSNISNSYTLRSFSETVKHILGFHITLSKPWFLEGSKQISSAASIY